MATEYCEVLRLPQDTVPPPEHTFIMHHEPVRVRQLACELTHARGRIVYEVWHVWESKSIGYIVPSCVAELAWKYGCEGEGMAAWVKLPPQQKNRLREAWTVVHRFFPKVPAYAARVVAERAVLERWSERDKGAMEKRVVDHIRHEWTNYDFRLESPRHSPDAGSTAVSVQQQDVDHESERIHTEPAVLEVVKPRMRDMIKSWLPEDTSLTELVLFWKRHGLLDSADSAKRGFREEDLLLTKPSLRDFGGAETIANLATSVGAWL